MGDIPINELASSEEAPPDEKKKTEFETKLKAVEKIMGEAQPTINPKAEHEKAKATAKTKAKSLYGDAKERSDAKKKVKAAGASGKITQVEEEEDEKKKTKAEWLDENCQKEPK